MQQQITHTAAAFEELKFLMDHVTDYSEKEFKGKLVNCINQMVNSITSGVSSAFNTFKQIEIDRIEAKYNREIELAAGDNEKIEKLENEKAEKKLAIEKKYADVQFAIKASQIIANTAMAISLCYAQLGPIAGPIMAGVMAAAGAVQLAAANAEREKVKSQTLNGGSGGDGEGNSTGRRVATSSVAQHAAGKYDVLGADDGQLYTGVPYIGTPTGIVSRPALISENGGELIVNAEDLRRLQQHINYPLVLEAIADARRGTAPTVIQHAAGEYSSIAIPDSDTTSTLAPLLARLSDVIETLSRDGVPASVLLSELERKQNERNLSRSIGSKKH